MNKDRRRGIEQLDDQLLGHLSTHVDSDAIREIVDEVGLPMPAWFNPSGTTLSDLGRTG